MNPSPTPRLTFIELLEENHPQAVAWVVGGSQAPRLSGLVKFFETPYGGVLIEAEVFGLPGFDQKGSSQFYALHIHENGDCSGQFQNAGAHLNPANASHPQHAGDLLPLLANQGYAWGAFYDKRFRIPDILGRSVILHARRDDFTTQPSGDSGSMIGCGVIMR